MTTQTKKSAKDYLSQAYRLDVRIGSKLQQVDSLNLLATKCTSTITGMPINPSPSCSPMADAICKVIDLENEISADVERLVDLKREIADVIRLVEDTEYQTLLEKRYLSSISWEQIATDMNYSLRWVYIVHGRALRAVEAIMKGEQT
jgi:hypothetical protein